MGFGAAAIAATAYTVVMASRQPLIRLRRGWLAPAWRIPILAARDTILLWAALWRRVAHGAAIRGRVVEVPVSVPSDGRLTAGKELLLTMGISVTPNTFVLGLDRQRRVLVVHQAVPTRPSSVGDLLALR